LRGSVPTETETPEKRKVMKTAVKIKKSHGHYLFSFVAARRGDKKKKKGGVGEEKAGRVIIGP
jgi:hypothetical protein